MTTIKTKITLVASGLIMLLMAGFAMFSAQQAFAKGATETATVLQDIAPAAVLTTEDCMVPFDDMSVAPDGNNAGIVTFFEGDPTSEDFEKEIIAAEKEFLQGLVKDGTITQAEADEMLAQLEDELTHMESMVMDINDPCLFPPLDDDCFVTDMAFPMPGMDDYDVQVFDEDMTEEEIIAELKAQEEQYLQELVDAGEITQAEADQMLADFEVFFDMDVTGNEGGIEEGVGSFIFDGDMTEEEITAELRAEEEKYLQRLVEDGTITQAEADEMLAEFDVFFEDMPVDFDDDMYFEDPMFPCGDLGEDTYFSTLMDVLNLDEDALFDAFDSGKTIAEIAKDQNVDVQKVIDALVAAEKASIEEMVDAGYISRAKADEWIVDLEKQIAFDVNYSYPDPYAIAAKLLNVAIDELWMASDEGKSIADIAQNKGVDSQRIIDAIVKAETEFVQAQVDADLISSAEAKIWLADIEDYAKSIVEDSFPMFEAVPFGSES